MVNSGARNALFLLNGGEEFLVSGDFFLEDFPENFAEGDVAGERLSTLPHSTVSSDGVSERLVFNSATAFVRKLFVFF